MKTALIIIDVQNEYFEEGNMTLENPIPASENIKLVMKKFRNEKQPIIHVQHSTGDKNTPVFAPDSFGYEIHENVAPVDGEPIVVKNYPNSFRETDLKKHLDALEITDLVICGMMTHNCVDSTTRAAKDLGYNITLISDSCATMPLEVKGITIPAKDVHFSFMAGLSLYYAKIVNTDEFVKEHSLV